MMNNGCFNNCRNFQNNNRCSGGNGGFVNNNRGIFDERGELIGFFNDNQGRIVSINRSPTQICCDENGVCKEFPTKCRNPFWPSFSHPRWLCCEDLFNRCRE